jgi:hypothetical protein
MSSFLILDFILGVDIMEICSGSLAHETGLGICKNTSLEEYLIASH